MTARYFLENVEKSQENPNSFFEGLYTKSFGKHIDFFLESRYTFSNFSLRENPHFFNKVPLDSKNEFSRVEKNFNNDNELNKTLKEFREDIYKITHDLIAPFSSKKFLIQNISGGFIQYVLYSSDVPMMAKLVMGIIISFYLCKRD
ncbi:hypothetical protein RT41_GL000521 [Lactococcus fujiensis JCM 16395]|uniref:Uncharacterized protein n=1 Tax=Lactococcus fujiensis JCM 16395 TaxID=1291764 RepID=A0A2A5RIY5_9LACT|nr:hypothetical protein RT41_GL000521 [Lactococcus fujiensis JCM 16395]